MRIKQHKLSNVSTCHIVSALFFFFIISSNNSTTTTLYWCRVWALEPNFQVQIPAPPIPNCAALSNSCHLLSVLPCPHQYSGDKKAPTSQGSGDQ